MNKLIRKKQTGKIAITTTLIIAVIILAFSTFRLGELNICTRSGMALLTSPERRCITYEELDEIQHKGDLLYEINRNLSGLQ